MLTKGSTGVDAPLALVFNFVTLGFSVAGAMAFNLSTEQGAFEPEATTAMGEAFDAACEELHCANQPEVVRERVATLIIAAAKQGELEPVRLRAAAIAGFAIS